MSPRFAAILGRNPALSVAELTVTAETYGFELGTVTKQYALLDEKFPEDLAERLGGITKLVRLAGEASSPDHAIDQSTEKVARKSKLSFGVSLYGPGDAGKLARRAKRQLTAHDVPARYVPATGEGGKPGKALSTAQVLHNELVGKGYEWVLVPDGKTWRHGRTVWIQDLEAFNKRDYSRPAADAKRGLLPPKLARVMVNLAGVKPGARIYDPFCGSGTVLMEAALTGYASLGSDISPHAVSDTKRNLAWLKDEFQATKTATVKVADASAPLPFKDIDAIVTEGYLGHPVRQGTTFAEILSEEKIVTSLTGQFLDRARKSLKSGGRLVITLPIWKLPYSGDRRLNVIDQASELGYTVIRPLPGGFKSAEVSDRNSILVSRPKQRVIHELFVFELSK